MPRIAVAGSSQVLPQTFQITRGCPSATCNICSHFFSAWLIFLLGLIPFWKTSVPCCSAPVTEESQICPERQKRAPRDKPLTSAPPAPSSTAEHSLTKLSPRVGRIQSLFIHAPVKDVAVTMVWVVDLGEIPGTIVHIKL